MKGMICAFCVTLLVGCQTPEEKEEHLAKTHCASCHMFPDPKLLDKTTWEQQVLPQMKFRMGLDYFPLRDFDQYDHKAILTALPKQAMVTQEEWEQIKNYYLTHAPDSLAIPENKINNHALPFTVSVAKISGAESGITLVESDTLNKKIYIGTGSGDLLQLSYALKPEVSIPLPSPPSSLLIEQTEIKILLMGIMDPNDQAKGELGKIDLAELKYTRILDSLKRPVHLASVDLNNDERKEFIVSEFGNFTGTLSVFQQHDSLIYQKRILQYLPGARNVVVKDFDKDEKPDILALMTQGDERIILFLNRGNFTFEPHVLLRFPPVYGSSYFEIADFNDDGHPDILYTNGDNADYSTILKPYHGVRVFLNDGNNKFTEDWFYPMHGASQAMSYDFDEDGDIDIAAVSFFPNFNKSPEQSFIYFENTPSGYVPVVSSLATAGRWLIMNLIDLNHDHKMDILVGAMNAPTGAPSAQYNQWVSDNTSLLVLINKN